MDSEDAKICLIAPTENLAARAKALIARQGLNVQVEVAELENAVALAKRLMKERKYLFISRRGTRDLLRKKLGIDVVNIPSEASDYIQAIQRLRKETHPIAFFSFEEEISNELRTICYLLDLKMHHYSFKDSTECRRVVKQAVRDGAAWGLGGIVSERYAKLYHLPYIRVESSDASILHALETAQQLYQNKLDNAQKQEQLNIRLERYQNILDYTHDAIIAIDEKGKISTTNQIANQLLRPARPPFTGRPIEDVLPNTHLTNVLRTGKSEIGQMMQLQGNLVSTNRVPILVDGQIKGVVATFQDIKTLQSMERDIRVKLHEKGLVAKYHLSDILGNSPGIVKAKKLARDFANSQFTVMIYGETGTGKEMFAQGIHNASPRKNGPFVAVNCTALNRDLLESELFGYADSSFTGAKKGGKAGLFEMAHGGTVFLDEIGDLPLEFQAPLLRVLQEKEVRRVGDDRVIPVDIRVIAATNRNLLQLVEEDKFRRDLYYRLNVLSLSILPLRQRENDYLKIARTIYHQVAAQQDLSKAKSFLRIMRACKDYAWPGNVRELTNVVERISLLLSCGQTEGEILQILQEDWKRQQQTPIPVSPAPSRPFRPSSAPLDPAFLQEALARNQGNVSQAARELGISRSTFYRHLKQ